VTGLGHGVGGLGFGDGAVGMAHAGVEQLDVFGAGGVGHGDNAILFDRGVGLQPGDEGVLYPAGAVGGHAEDAVGMLDDDGLGCVV
jgi:hypothetical protein